MYKLSLFIINYAIHTINNKQTSTIFKIEPNLMTKINMGYHVTAANACCMVLGYQSCPLKQSGATKKYRTLNPYADISQTTESHVPAYIL
jgi:hypothetical protein